VALALVKAALVAFYFMHLRFERKTFVILVSFPLVLAVILIIALLPDVAGYGH
jgi:caa(3)-type oxidase subunit IV